MSGLIVSHADMALGVLKSAFDPEALRLHLRKLVYARLFIDATQSVFDRGRRIHLTTQPSDANGVRSDRACPRATHVSMDHLDAQISPCRVAQRLCAPFRGRLLLQPLAHLDRLRIAVVAKAQRLATRDRLLLRQMRRRILRALTIALNPHRYQVVCLSETDFGRLDLYRSLALALGITPPHRRAQLWRELKARILDLTDTQQILPLWILDEAHNLSPEFFRDLPAFLNFAFDSRDLLTVWLVGHPSLAHTLQRVPYAALAGRIQVRVHLKPVLERERFVQFIQHAFKSAGLNTTLLANSGLKLIRQASQGLPRQADRILRNAMSLAAGKKLNTCPTRSSYAPSRSCDDRLHPRTRHRPLALARRHLRRGRRYPRPNTQRPRYGVRGAL
jgi:MSHA biogenesis protein MshM